MADLNLDKISKALEPIRISGKRVDSLAPPKTVFSFFLAPAYDDWRRYMSNYYLYLPFVGIVSIDAQRYVNHTMSCKLFFDVRTGALKFDLLSDDVLQESHTGNVRVNFPATSATPYASSMNKVGASVESAVGVASGVMSGNVLGAAGSAARGFMDIVKPIPKKSTGGFTPSVNIYDSLHVYLITEAPEIYYGDGVLERYGKPDNRFITIGSCSGYVEIADAELHTSATEEEQMEILSLLIQGVII